MIKRLRNIVSLLPMRYTDANNSYQRALAFIGGVCVLGISGALAVDRDYAAEQAAINQSAKAIAASVVQIRTVGGFERIGDTQLTPGPTTGLIVSEDGYIVSSAFNFAQRPSSILVRLPNGKRVAAELVARDLNRMLVLLKVETGEELPVPDFVPQREVAVGQWAIALGRTFQEDSVDASIGIISGLKRMQGRAIQTDCNVSAANYGGPLVDIRGRVYGVLVPMSPQQAGEGVEAEVAGAEFYDSGIGFAIPLEHVFSVLDKWKKGDDLLPGKLGVAMKSGSHYVEPPTIVTIWPGSPAAKARWEPQDTIIAVNGKAVQTQNHVQMQLRPLYAGDTVTISLRRGTGDKAEEFDTEVTLVGKLQPYRPPFLGILPKTGVAKGDAEKPDGVVVDGVWPASPASKAGIEPGDRITKLAETNTETLAEVRQLMKGLQPEEELEVEVARDEKLLSLKLTLGTMPEDILPEVDVTKLAAASDARELESLKLPQFPQEAKYLTPGPALRSDVHSDGEDGTSRGLLIWLVETKKTDLASLASEWQSICDTCGLVLLFAHPADDKGWQFDDLEYIDALGRLAVTRFSADPQRTVIMGSGKAGQLAYALGLRRRGMFSGIIIENAPLPRTLDVPQNTPGGQLAILSILPKSSSVAPLLKRDVKQLREAGFPVSLLEQAPSEEKSPGFDAMTRVTVARWLVGLAKF